MLLHNPIGNSQADTGSAKFAASCLVYTIKAFEDLGLIRLRDSDSRITHANHSLIALHFQSEFHYTGRRRVLDGIVEQDSQQSLQGSVVGQYWKLAIRRVLRELQITGLSQGGPLIRDVCDCRTQVDQSQVQALATGVSTRERQQFFNQRRRSFRLQKNVP